MRNFRRPGESHYQICEGRIGGAQVPILYHD
jgi:hypothetical protein